MDRGDSHYLSALSIRVEYNGKIQFSIGTREDEANA
jgi:hypothetical protein